MLRDNGNVILFDTYSRMQKDQYTYIVASDLVQIGVK